MMTSGVHEGGSLAGKVSIPASSTKKFWKATNSPVLLPAIRNLRIGSRLFFADDLIGELSRCGVGRLFLFGWGHGMGLVRVIGHFYSRLDRASRADLGP